MVLSALEVEINIDYDEDLCDDGFI